MAHNAKNALRNAVKNGDIKAVRRAVNDGANPKDDASYALRVAANNGHHECVGFLITLSQPKDMNSAALRNAVSGNYAECTRLLIPVSDVNITKAMLRDSGNHTALAFLDSIIQEDGLRAKHFREASCQDRVSL